MYNLPSLKQLTVRSQSVASSQSYIPFSSGPRKLWSDESLQKAVAAVEKGEDSIRRAADKYGLPRSTLHDHISEKVQYGANQHT